MAQDEEENLQNIYIDTSYFCAYLLGKREEKKASKDILQRIEDSVKNNSEMQVVIPLTVLGELINDIYRDVDNKGKIDKLFYDFLVLVEKLGADFQPPKEDHFFYTTKRIKKEDKLNIISNDDILIVAQALCDPDSSRLICQDRPVLNSNKIIDLEKEMRKNGKRNRRLRITEEF